MSQFCIEVADGTAVRLLTAGKYCDRDILVSAGNEGYHRGLAEGKQAEYDRFWDAYQQNGNKTDYDQAFAYNHWPDAILRPKHPLKFEGSNGGRQVFTGCKALTEINVPIYAKNTRLIYTFQNCTLLKTIVLLHCEGVSDFNKCFDNCGLLENITIEGEIPLSISFAQSTKLTKESIKSIINALSATASGQTLTLSATAVTNAFGSVTAVEWTSLIGGKSNWTISLM